MSSLWKRKQKKLYLTKMQKNPTPTLQIYNGLKSLARVLTADFYIKRIPLLHLPNYKKANEDVQRIEQFSLEASMTVEAAVILPMLLFFFLNLMSAVEIMRLHGNLELALWKNGRAMAIFWYEDTNKILDDLWIRSAIMEDLGKEYLEKSPLTYGAAGLVFLESVYNEDECMDIKVTYQVSPFFDIPGFSSFRMANRYYARAWTGYSVDSLGQEDKEDIVFVTPYGEVYHEDRDCSYLVRNFIEVSAIQVHFARNDQGEPYHLCQICKKGGQKFVYITPGGNKYHERMDCPSLSRTVMTINRTLAESGYRSCNMCEK